jgi:hypothetical protein
VKQQQRIEQGLQSGALNTREAGRLEIQEAQISRLQARAMRDGSVSAAESQRLKHAQNSLSRDIKAEKHDAQHGNPVSASSQRMQADVARNIAQQQRIENGLHSGALSTQEAARMEHGQARVAQREAHAARDGHVGPHEQAHIQLAENHQSRRIYRQKHD